MGTILSTNPFNRYWTPPSDLIHPFEFSPNAMYVTLRIQNMLEGANFGLLTDPVINRDFQCFWRSDGWWRCYPYKGSINSAELWFTGTTFNIRQFAQSGGFYYSIFTITGTLAQWPILDNQNTKPAGFAYGGDVRIIVPDQHISWDGADYADR